MGGAREASFHDTKHWYDVTDDSQLIAPAADYFDVNMQKHFKEWENVETEVDTIWTGRELIFSFFQLNTDEPC